MLQAADEAKIGLCSVLHEQLVAAQMARTCHDELGTRLVARLVVNVCSPPPHSPPSKHARLSLPV